MKFLKIFPILLLCISQIVSGQNNITLEDYKRAVGFLGENTINKKVYNLRIQANWFPDSTGLWYVHHSKDSKKYLQISLPGLLQTELFDHTKLAVLLSDSLDMEISAEKLPLTSLEYRNKKELLIGTVKRDFILNRDNYTLRPAGKEKEDTRKEMLSPDKRWIAFQKDYNLHIRSAGDSTVRQLSNAGEKGYEYASWYGWYDIMEGENGERPANFRVNWSDNSQWISTTICDLRSAQKMYLLDWSVDSLYRPRLLSYYRGSPGDTGMVYTEPVFFHVPSGSESRITQGDYYVNRIVKIDENAGRIYFLASGREQARNPYYQHLYSISFSGKDLNLLTPENFNHSISIAPAGDFFVDNYSTVNQASTTVLRDLVTGDILLELGHADVSALGDWKAPEIFTATARDGKTTIYGALWKPVNFDPEKKYPIIELRYTGPHTHLFPMEFSRAFMLQPYAELGEQFFWMDTTRVGIFGHSAGGYDAAHALLAYPDFYKVAVASSADHDHRMEKAWWPEMYMGWPVDSAYHLQSNITMGVVFVFL